MTTPADWESGPKGSDRVGTAGKGSARAWTWKAPRKSDREDLIESETPKGSARRKARKGFRRKRPFLENSTACQKSTPDMLIPRPLGCPRGRGSFEENTARMLWTAGIIPPGCPALVMCHPDDRGSIHGEFDPGSGRTLAACLTHASRTMNHFGGD